MPGRTGNAPYSRVDDCKSLFFPQPWPSDCGPLIIIQKSHNVNSLSIMSSSPKDPHQSQWWMGTYLPKEPITWLLQNDVYRYGCHNVSKGTGLPGEVIDHIWTQSYFVNDITGVPNDVHLWSIQSYWRTLPLCLHCGRKKMNMSFSESRGKDSASGRFFSFSGLSAVGHCDVELYHWTMWMAMDLQGGLVWIWPGIMFFWGALRHFFYTIPLYIHLSAGHPQLTAECALLKWVTVC